MLNCIHDQMNNRWRKSQIKLLKTNEQKKLSDHNECNDFSVEFASVGVCIYSLFCFLWLFVSILSFAVENLLRVSYASAVSQLKHTQRTRINTQSVTNKIISRMWRFVLRTKLQLIFVPMNNTAEYRQNNDDNNKCFARACNLLGIFISFAIYDMSREGRRNRKDEIDSNERSNSRSDIDRSLGRQRYGWAI